MRAALLSICTVLAAAPLSAQPTKLAPGLRSLVRQEGLSTVFVKLRQPPLGRSASLTQRCDGIAAVRNGVAAAMPGGEVRIETAFESIAALTVSVTPAGLAALEDHPDVLRVDSLATGAAALGRNLPFIRGDDVHRRRILGEDVTVAVLDVGVEVTHPDIAGRVVEQKCFCFPNCCPDGSAQQSGAGSAATEQPHGVHVTGIIGSAGIVSAPGTAPGVRLVSVKVLDEDNRGFLTDWIAALDWIITQRPDVRAVNMSLASDATYEGFCDQPEDPNDLNSFIASLAEAFDLLRARNVPVFAASGNIARVRSISAPACIEAAIAVGAVNSGGNLWRDSNERGTNRSAALDLLAPGVMIVSDGIDGGLDTITGTSMATAFATGSAALLLSMNRSLSVDDLEDALERTGIPVVDRQSSRTFPRIDVLHAMREVWRLTQPLLGGGSRHSDCLVSWDFGDAATMERPVAGLSCHDGDPGCDRDDTPGHCGFDVRICLNRMDGRVPGCDTSSPVESYELRRPDGSGDAIDAANAAAILGALPPPPIAAADVCTDKIRLTVPAGSRTIRFLARAADGRRDADGVRLVCLP